MVWIIARQHPGESMAEWFVEGLLERLIDEADPVTAQGHVVGARRAVPAPGIVERTQGLAGFAHDCGPLWR